MMWMGVLFFVLIFYWNAKVYGVDESNEDVEIDEYYGVPLGAIHFSHAGLSAEAYAADEYTIVLNHLMHHPKEPGCNSIIIGPPRPQDKTHLVEGRGVLMSLSNEAKFRMRRHLTYRHKRQSGFYPGGLLGLNWPSEFAHMVLSPESEKMMENQEAKRPSSFAGIELKHTNKTNVKKIDLEELERLEEEINRSTTRKPKTILVKEEELDRLEEEVNQSTQKPNKMAVKSLSEKMDKSSNSTSSILENRNTTETMPSAKSTTPNSAEDDEDIEEGDADDTTDVFEEDETTIESTKEASTTPTTQITTKITPTTRTTTETSTTKEKIKLPMKTAKPLKVFDRSPITAHSRRTTTSSTTTTSSQEGSTSDEGGEDYSFERTSRPSRYSTTTRGAGIVVSFPETKKKKQKLNVQIHPIDEISFKDVRRAPIRRLKSDGEGVRIAPMRNGASEVHFSKEGDRWISFEVPRDHNDAEIDFPSISTRARLTTASTTLPTPSTTTPLFYVIEDPREARRLARLQRLKEAGFVMEPITKTTSVSRETTTRVARPSWVEDFTLPEVTDRIAAFALTNGAKLKDYQWFGVYDHCSENHVPLIYLKDIDPPKEEKIMPLSGWSHNVSSYRVQILNCNTVLIPGFTYDREDASENTYFYIGVGKFPDYIEKQLRVSIVGQKENEPLRNYYDKEDVLLRLPKTYRTFDIDFISIYNDDEQRSYGHVIVPSLLVPPCNEE